MLRYVSPKVKKLLEILHGYKPSDNFEIVADDDMSFDDESFDEDDDDDMSDDDDSDDMPMTGGDTKRPRRGAGGGNSSTHYVAVKKVTDEASEKEVNFMTKFPGYWGRVYSLSHIVF